MDMALNNALKELEEHGAVGLPEAGVVEQAADGSHWEGKKSDGERWSLDKLHNESYNSEY
jgi:hypothetical protein